MENCVFSTLARKKREGTTLTAVKHPPDDQQINLSGSQCTTVSE